VTLPQDESGAALLHGVPTQLEPVADDTPLGTDNVEAEGIDPRPDDDARGLHHDLVVRGASPGTPRCVSLGDMALALRSSGIVGPGVTGLLLPDSPGLVFLPFN
jgi:hypothetical protein